mgnify:CR=1 FL=1
MVLVLTFLDTKCTEACPIIAGQIADAWRLLTPSERACATAVAISTDPRDDTRANVRAFLARHRAGQTVRCVGADGVPRRAARLGGGVEERLEREGPRGRRHAGSSCGRASSAPARLVRCQKRKRPTVSACSTIITTPESFWSVSGERPRSRSSSFAYTP